MKRVLLFLLLLCIASGPSSAVIDPFYRHRMESGIRAFDQENWESAAHQLRIACFGYLDDPAALVDGLVRLAITEVKRGDEDAFRRDFSRLVELEERFSAYSNARLSPDLRQEFEALASRLVSAVTLRSTGGFQTIADRADSVMLAEMPAAERRAELTRRLQAEPESTEWLIEMTRLELAERRPQPALDLLDRLPTSVAATAPASCLRQQAASEVGSCDRTDLAQPFCHNVPDKVVEFRLQCLADAGRWAEASGVIAGLGPELRQKRRIARLERRVRKNTPAPEPTDTPAAGSLETPPPPVEMPTTVAMPTPEPPPAPVDTPTTVAMPTPGPPPADPRELDRLRGALASAATADELGVLMAKAESLADRNPESRAARLLAAEIAYLRSDWPAAVHHFQQAGPLAFAEVDLAFYRAVALFESGDPDAAAEVLRPVASRLQRNGFVDAYVDRILAPGI